MAQSGAAKRAHQLLQKQKFAVLSTQDGEQPYCNLIAFATADNGDSIIFFTRRNTRKYANLRKNAKVSLLIDDRHSGAEVLTSSAALTLLGTAQEIPTDLRPSMLQTLLASHPDLSDHLARTDYALFEVRIAESILAEFDQAVSLTPETNP